MEKKSSTVVIGVGGGGRGVVNWVKYFLEKEYGTCEKANTAILVIDGPENDQYILPGGFQINTSELSSEFFPLRMSPEAIIRAISEGRGHSYISQWLSREDAERIPSEIAPPLGYGGNRVAANVSLYLEIEELLDKIRSVLRKAASFQENALLDIFVAGSLAGGTGSGMLLGISHLVKSNKRETDSLYGVILLPNGFERVFEGEANVMKRDAKSFAGLREFLRSQAASDNQRVRFDFSDSIKINNSQLFKLAFLIDGQGEGTQLSNVYPVYGLSAKSAELILAFIKNLSTIEADKPQWFSAINDQIHNHQRFSAFGIHSCYFPVEDIVASFSLRITAEVYRRMYDVPHKAVDEGRNLAVIILRTTEFGTMLLGVEELEKLPLQPPSEPKYSSAYQTLQRNLRVGNDTDSNFPNTPVLRLEEEVKTTKIFMPVTNEILVEECRQKTEDYLGHKEKIIYATVWDWVKMQIELVSKVYASAVCRTIWELFYDPETKKVRNLRDTPYSIGIARDMLLVLRNTTNEFEKKIQETRREYLGSDNNVVITQEQKVGMLEADMKGEKKDRQFQERYISESQKLLELKLWEILLSACELCINKYKEVNKILWEEIGGHDRGWVTFLDNYNRFITDRQGEVDNRREKMRQNKARTYVPDKYGEQYLYNDRVKRRHIVDIILGEMRWGLGKFEDEFLTALLEDGLKPDDLKNFKILLLSPPLPKDAAAEGRYSDRRITSVRLEQHYPEELKRVAESKIEDLKNLTIWDAIYYNYISRPDGIVTKEGKTTASIYAAGIVEDILRQSGLLLDIHHSAEKGKGRPVINQYIMSYALTSLAPQPNSKEDLAKCVFDEIQEKLAGIKDESKMDKQITGLKVINGVSLFEWGYYKKCQEGYGKLMSEYSTYPVHLTIHEKMAARLEQKLYDELLLRRNEQLHYTVVRYLEPKFETFAYALVAGFAYALVAGLFGETKQIRKDNGYQLCYQLEVIAPSGRSIPISLETDLERLLDVYLAQNGEGKALRAEIERRWDNFIKSSKNIKEELSDYLKKFDISDINTEGLLEVAHFKLAVKAIILLFLDSR